MIYTIEKNQHRSGYFFSPIAFPKGVKFFFKFHLNALYNPKALPDHGISDINKLGGYAEMWWKYMSAHTGWRVTEQNYEDRIQLLAYCHIDWERHWHHLANVKIGWTYMAEMWHTNKGYYWNITDCHDKTWGNVHIRQERPKVLPLGWHYYPYWGGTSVAPHRVDISLDYVKDW